jgi:uncharacterized protein (DUF1810 family)
VTPPPHDPHDLDRFVQAQATSYAQALAELRAGRKRSHWSWFVLPQAEGLGSSAMAARYAIRSLAEAKAYLDHPLLGPRLRECVAAMNAHRGTSARDILGDVDAMKFRSCLTLFARASPGEPLFAEALDRFYSGQPDEATLAILAREDAG